VTLSYWVGRKVQVGRVKKILRAKGKGSGGSGLYVLGKSEKEGSEFKKNAPGGSDFFQANVEKNVPYRGRKKGGRGFTQGDTPGRLGFKAERREKKYNILDLVKVRSSRASENINRNCSQRGTQKPSRGD